MAVLCRRDRNRKVPVVAGLNVTVRPVTPVFQVFQAFVPTFFWMSNVKPVWDATENEFVPRLMLPLSLSYDHRVIDGAAAARFMVHLVGVLRDLRRVLL